jgi:glutathione S-transferase
MKLYRFRYSPYARKVQMVLDLLGKSYDVVEVPYDDRDELATLTGGYIHVPVLVDERGAVVKDSRVICEHLLREPAAAEKLSPSPWEGPIWAYADFAEGALEEVLFRIAAPAIRDRWPTPGARALFTLVKERKYGAGCVDDWARGRDALVESAKHLLGPTLRTLSRRPFLFGPAPTLADAALYGQCKMLSEGEPALLGRVSEDLVAFAARVEAAAGS